LKVEALTLAFKASVFCLKMFTVSTFDGIVLFKSNGPAGDLLEIYDGLDILVIVLVILTFLFADMVVVLLITFFSNP